MAAKPNTKQLSNMTKRELVDMIQTLQDHPGTTPTTKLADETLEEMQADLDQFTASILEARAQLKNADDVAKTFIAGNGMGYFLSTFHQMRAERSRAQADLKIANAQIAELKGERKARADRDAQIAALVKAQMGRAVRQVTTGLAKTAQHDADNEQVANALVANLANVDWTEELRADYGYGSDEDEDHT